MNSEDTQKDLLIASMEKLINYIQTSKENQWQIFESLSKQDIQKIINNFSDNNHKLRKLSLTMLGILINDSNPLKQRLCKRMEITLITGKICFNFSIVTEFFLSNQKCSELVNLLKQPVNREDQIFPIWMINLRKQPFKIDFIPSSALRYIDPFDNLIGLTLDNDKRQSPKKLFFSIFESITEPSQNPIKKSMFTVAPQTTRNYSPATQRDQRFNRTSNIKTSLKKIMKGSLIQGSDQSESKQPFYSKPRYISQSRGINSERVSPKKQFFSMKNSHQNSINTLKETHHIHEEISTAPTNQQRNVSSRPVINNTHIYVNTPVNTILINSHNNEKVSTRNQIIFRYDYPQTCKNLTQDIQSYRGGSSNVNKISITNLPQSGFPFKKYERVTKKPNVDHGQLLNTNVNRYQKFVNSINSSLRSNRIASSHCQ